MSSLDRLIDLAKKTGDRLIVHDPIEDRDIIIMDVDEYEKLISNRYFGFTRNDVRKLTSEQMLDQINRDIAIWRADKEMDREWEKELALEDEYDNLPPFDPFSEVDFHSSEWHTAGNVLEDKFKNISLDKNNSKDIEDDFFINEQIKKVPFKQEESEIDWTENNLDNDEEPIFYEEPV